MISLLLFMLMAFFKACADTMAHHYATSVFRSLDFRFWNAEESHKYAKIIFGKYRWDGWHIAYSLAIISAALSVALHEQVLAWYFEVAIAGLAYIVTFNTSYNHILRRRDKTQP